MLPFLISPLSHLFSEKTFFIENEIIRDQKKTGTCVYKSINKMFFHHGLNVYINNISCSKKGSEWMDGIMAFECRVFMINVQLCLAASKKG